MKYYVLYHELGHDVLNLKDLEENENNIGKIMYPNMSINQRLTMDDFMKNSKELFKEIKVKSKMQWEFSQILLSTKHTAVIEHNSVKKIIYEKNKI